MFEDKDEEHRRDVQTDKLVTFLADFVRYIAYFEGVDFTEPALDVVLSYVNSKREKTEQFIDSYMKWPISSD